MPLSLTLIDLDGLDGLISDSIPLLQLWAVALAVTLVAILARAGIAHWKRSPVEKMSRRRFG